ncbi:DUF1259 domain-containing protein [Actinomadura scrupuli]|uniref:LppY/LpqO family protein n=1 Tax=Actinomadura scrupuli TaxID=559629 RepID=UPI003D97BE24
MTVRTCSHLRRAAIAVAAGVTVTAALTIGSASAQAPGVDWHAVGQAMGTTLRTEPGDVHTAEFMRTDLRVVNAGVTENPGMELGAEAMFHQSSPGKVVVIGEATLTGPELNKVAARLDQGNVEITAIHKHLQDESPRLWWLHYDAYGDPVAIARTLHAALALTGTPLHPPAERETAIALNTGELDRIIGTRGENENGVYQFHVPVAEKITDTRAHLTLPSLMEASTLLMFQPMGDGKAAVNGDFVMTADQVNPVIKALQSHGISIIEVHNHLLHEQPRLFYLHFWDTGDAATLARGLRAGLDQLHAP